MFEMNKNKKNLYLYFSRNSQKLEGIFVKKKNPDSYNVCNHRERKVWYYEMKSKNIQEEEICLRMNLRRSVMAQRGS